MKPKAVVRPSEPEEEAEDDAYSSSDNEEERIPITEKIKIMLSKIFEVEDQPIVK